MELKPFRRGVLSAPFLAPLLLLGAPSLLWAGAFTFGNRLNEATSLYYTLAWFDRYVKAKVVADTPAEERADRQAIADNKHSIDEALPKLHKAAHFARKAIGVADARTSEAVKIFVVRKDPNLTTEQLMDYCKQQFTGYKKPKYIEFRDELPKTNVGKILRRELRSHK